MYVFVDYDLLLSNFILATFHFRVPTNSIDICLLFVCLPNEFNTLFFESSDIDVMCVTYTESYNG